MHLQRTGSSFVKYDTSRALSLASWKRRSGSVPVRPVDALSGGFQARNLLLRSRPLREVSHGIRARRNGSLWWELHAERFFLRLDLDIPVKSHVARIK